METELQELLPPNTTMEIFELDGIPPFNQDEENSPPPRVVELKRKIREADGILFATPEYNYSIPGSAEERHRLGFQALRGQCMVR